MFYLFINYYDNKDSKMRTSEMKRILHKARFYLGFIPAFPLTLYILLGKLCVVFLSLCSHSSHIK